MSISVENLSRMQLENIVIQQSKQLRTLEEALEAQKKLTQKSEEDYEELASVVMRARQVLSC